MFALCLLVRCCIAHVKFEVLKVMFWNVVLCPLVYGYHSPADMMQNPRRCESPVLYMFDIKI